MSSLSRQLRLGAYLSYGTGHHPAAWRLAESVANGAQNIRYYLELAKIAEQGLFDFIFLSDTPSVFQDDKEGYGSRVAVFEPLTLLSALAVSTRNIGLIATASTTYKHPYDIAREFASLDLISEGRAGWNIVTSSKSAAAGNYGLIKHPEHSERYKQAEESLDVVTGLWDSWDDDALIRNKESGQFYRPEKCHRLDHSKNFFRVSGPLNLSRPIQGYPVLVQAGSSETGREFAARTAEVVFTAQSSINSARIFFQDLKKRASKYSRINSDILIMPGLCPFMGKTDEEAQAKLDQLNELVHPRLGLSMLSELLGGFDLSGYDLDQPLPKLPPSNGNQSRRELIEKMANNLSIRELYQKVAVARGHAVVVGSYRKVAETIADWFESKACDGFNIMPPSMPGSLKEFVNHVVPELQKMGLMKKQYVDGTLREKLGLRRPKSRYQEGNKER